jgi:hypothetical protein
MSDHDHSIVRSSPSKSVEPQQDESDVLVTVADKAHLRAAKQLFSSVYHNSGWKGSYCLVTDEGESIEHEWFRCRGAQVVQLPLPIAGEDWFERGFEPWNGPASALKLHLFGPYFRSFRRVVYLDSDIIVRGSLDGLLRTHRFVAAPDTTHSIAFCFRYQTRHLKDQNRVYDLSGRSFNSGVFAFTPETLSRDAFDELVSLHNRHKEYNLSTDQGVLNLYFYGVWKRLHKRYNVLQFYSNIRRIRRCGRHTYLGTVLHFAGPDKPWNEGNAFYSEWMRNLEAADRIRDLARPVPPSLGPTRMEEFRFLLHCFSSELMVTVLIFLNRLGVAGIVTRTLSKRSRSRQHQ